MGTAITGVLTAALATFAIFCFGQGVGNVFAGPISARLLSKMVDRTDYGGSRYKAVIIFTGCAMVASVVRIASGHLRPSRLQT